MKITVKSFAALTVKTRESFADFDLSSESLEKLAQSFPDIIDFDVNADLTPVCFPVLVANVFNKNGEGVTSSAAVSIADSLPPKFTDLNHDRKQIVGHIVGTSFSKFNDDHTPMTREEALASTEPFNVNCYAVVYDKVNPKFAKELLSTADEKVWSASWELVFNDFDIGIGSGNITDVEVLKGKEAYANAKFLRKNKGTGYNSEGKEVRRIISKDVIGVGIGFTQKPAAAVKGVAIAEFEVKDDLEDENSSHSSENNVTDNRNKKVMDELLEKVDKLLSLVAPQESQANALVDVFSEEIREISKKWVADRKKAQEDKDEAFAEVQRQKDLVASTAADLAEAKKDLEALKSAQAQSFATQTFNDRMAEVDAKFELNDKQRPFVAKELSGLALDDESFAATLEKFAALFPEKKAGESKASELSEEELDARVKAEIEKRIPAIAKQTSLAEADVRELLSTASLDDAGLPNGGEIKQPTLREKWLKGLDVKTAVKVG